MNVGDLIKIRGYYKNSNRKAIIVKQKSHHFGSALLQIIFLDAPFEACHITPKMAEVISEIS